MLGRQPAGRVQQCHQLRAGEWACRRCLVICWLFSCDGGSKAAVQGRTQKGLKRCWRWGGVTSALLSVMLLVSVRPRSENARNVTGRTQRHPYTATPLHWCRCPAVPSCTAQCPWNPKLRLASLRAVERINCLPNSLAFWPCSQPPPLLSPSSAATATCSVQEHATSAL